MPDFPHLSDTDFPHLGTVDPYRRAVDFDYVRYDYEATAKLCRVSWPQDYRHVVNWASAAARDDWFDGLEGEVVELSQGFVHAQTDRVRVPVPYDMALTYNYLFMRVPRLTEDRDIDYEASDGVRTICAFIVDAAYLAPSTTELTIMVDAWTTYLPQLTVAGMMLERGHAPMHALSAADYLQNPIARCGDLLTPDVDFGGTDIVRGGSYVALSTGALAYILALTIPYSEMATLGSAGTVTASAATFSDLQTRDGYQRGVSGYVWGFGGRDYAQAMQPSAPAAVSGDVPTGLYYYALASTNAPANLATLLDAYPQIATACKAIYVVPQNLVSIGSSTYTLAGVALRNVFGNPQWQAGGTVALTKALFGYPTKYADIAKLYTSPYAHLEVADDLGQTIALRIEDTAGSVEIVQRLSMAWPALDWQAAIDAQSTAGAVSYTWQRLDGTTVQRSIPGADLAALTIDLGIPTYSLYLSAPAEWALSHAGQNDAARARALFAYDSAARNANTTYENALDSNATANTNAAASADTSVTNTANQGNTQTANTQIQNNTRTYITGAQNTTTANLAADANQQTYDNGNADGEYTMYATDASLKSEAVAGVANMASNALAGNLAGVASTGVASIVNITTSSALSNLSQLNIYTKIGIAQSHNTYASGQQQSLNTSVTGFRNTESSTITANNVALANTNATNSANTSKANALRSKNTGDSNAGYSRGEAIDIAKGALELARTADAFAAYEDAEHMPPIAHGEYGNVPSMLHESYRNRGIHVRAVTQSASAIARAGDAMLRYGYRYDGSWPLTTWCPSDEDYSYWQASDVQASAADIGNPSAWRELTAILAAGTTVWNDPSKIGQVM